MTAFKKYLSELTAKQKKIDKDKDGEIDSEDLAALRKEEKDEEVCEECGKNPCECDKDENMKEGYTGKGNHRPGWMLRADPELAKKFKEIQDRHKTMAKWAGKTVPKKDVKEEVELEEGNGAYMAAVAAMPAAAYVGAKLGAKLHDLAVKRAHKQIDASNAKRKATIAAKKVQKEEVEVMSEADEKKHFTNAMNNIPAHRRDAARKAYKHLRSKGQTHAAAMTSMHNTFKEELEEADLAILRESIKTTHEDPLVVVHDKHGIHTHANLSVANNIHGTKVSHTDVHKGTVKTKNRDGQDITFSISKHHASEVKESVGLEEGYDKSSASHKAAKETAKGMGDHVKVKYNDDGSATIHTKGKGAVSSTRVVDHHHDTHKLGYNRSREDYKKASFKDSKGLTHTTKETGENSHEIRIHESVEIEEGRFVKAAGGVPSDKHGNPKQPNPPKSVLTVSLKQLLKNKKENPGQSPFKTQDDKVKKYYGMQESFSSKEDAIAHAKVAVKKSKDSEDGVELWHHEGKYHVNHEMNSAGRDSLKNKGAKHVGTVYQHGVKLKESMADYFVKAAQSKGINARVVTSDQKKKERAELDAKRAAAGQTHKPVPPHNADSGPADMYNKSSGGKRNLGDSVEHDQGVLEATDTVVKDKSGKVVSWKHEGDWKKVDPKKDPLGKIRNLAGKALKKTKGMKEEVEVLDEKFVNGREYASHGLMHPDHAKMDIHKVSGQHVDFYASGSGDKMQGKVTKNDGKSVHIQAHKELGDGKLHKFKVTPHLPKTTNEETAMEFTQEELQLIEEFIQIAEKMNLSKATMGDVIKDFKKSDAPQFKGKSAEKRRMMAIAAKLEADRSVKKEDVQTDSFKGFLAGIEEGAGSVFDWKSHKSQTGMKTGEKKTGSQGTITKTSGGVKHERDYDKAEKETSTPEGQEKRGRGRPKGSASGARQKGSAPKDDRYDATGHRLLLPNSNR